MEITPLQAKVAAFASTSNMRPELACVKVDALSATATDSFRLVEITRTDLEAPKKAGKAVLIPAKQLMDAKQGKEVATIDAGMLTVGERTERVRQVDIDSYPVLERIWEEADARTYVDVQLNGKYLADAAAILAKLNTSSKITLRVPTEKVGAPVVLTAEGSGHKARALVMPVIG